MLGRKSSCLSREQVHHPETLQPSERSLAQNTLFHIPPRQFPGGDVPVGSGERGRNSGKKRTSGDNFRHCNRRSDWSA